MKSDVEIEQKIQKINYMINEELNTATENPVRQWAILKTYQAEKNILEWVLE